MENTLQKGIIFFRSIFNKSVTKSIQESKNIWAEQTLMREAALDYLLKGFNSLLFLSWEVPKCCLGEAR